MASLTTPKLSTLGLPIKIITFGVYVVFEEEHRWNGSIKNDRVNANLSNTIRLTSNTPIDFAFGPRLAYHFSVN